MDKIFKNYHTLINKVYNTLEHQQAEGEKTAEMRMENLRKELQSRIDEINQKYDDVSKKRDILDEKLRDLESEHKLLKENYSKKSHDNHRMKYILEISNDKIEALKSDVEYYKFRVKEMSDVSEEEEDAIKQVLRKNKPAQKSTDCHDLTEYIQGDDISQYNEEKQQMNEKELQKEEELIKQKQRKFPSSVEMQTDPVPAKDFAVQIKNSEEVIPRLDIRVKSAEVKERKFDKDGVEFAKFSKPQHRRCRSTEIPGVTEKKEGSKGFDRV